MLGTVAANAPTDAANLATAQAAYAAKVAAAQQTAFYVGIAGAIAGVFGGGVIGKRYGTKAKYGGAIGAALVLGLGSYYTGFSLLSPPAFVPPMTAEQAMLNVDLSLPALTVG